MNAVEFLESLYKLKKKIECKREELSILNSMLYKINAEMSDMKVQTSRNLDPLGSAMAKICDIEAEIQVLLNEYLDRIREITEVIESVSDIQEYDLLHMKYVQNYSWTEIAEEWGVSLTWVHKIKKRALKSVQAILDAK